VTGVLVAPREPAALAAALRPLLADPARRSFFGAAGRDRAESRYQWQRIAAGCAQVYERCAERTGVPAVMGRAAR
jgi:glycosyltransferase involved in cell wall biosynthesis